MTHRIWVRPDNIKANSADGGSRPVVIIDHGTPQEVACQGVDIFDDLGKVVARVVYDPESATAHVWVETELHVLPIKPELKL